MEDIEDIEFRLRARAEADSPEWVLLNYLNSRKTLYPPRDMAMIALMSYWLPWAYRAVGDRESFKEALEDSIYRTKLHLQRLQRLLGNSPDAGTVWSEVEALEESMEEKVELASPKNTQSIESRERKVEIEASPARETEWFNPLKSGSANPK